MLAVVGLSADWYRPSYFAAKYMQEHGYRVIPVNPKYDTILGESATGRCATSRKRSTWWTYSARRRTLCQSRRMPSPSAPRCSGSSSGVKNEAAAAKARAAGLEAVMDRCVKIEHGRLFGGLNWVGVNTKVISAKRPRWLAY